MYHHTFQIGVSLSGQGLRGKIHVHLCNARRPISVLRAEYPQLIIPLGTAENDPWWQPGHDCHYELSDETPSSELFKREMRGRNTEQELYDRAEAALEQIMKLSRGVQSKSVSLVMELARRLDS